MTRGAGVVQRFRVNKHENKVRISNGRPGLSKVRITVNGKHFTVRLKAGQKRTLKITKGLTRERNRIVLRGYGARGAKASVKQFKGCGKNYAYIFVWDSFARQVGDFQITVAMDVAEHIQEQRTYPRNQQEGWSGGTASLTQCTRAVGALKNFVISDTWLTAETDWRC